MKVIIIGLLLAVSASVFAGGEEQISVQGQLRVGTTDSAIEPAAGEGVGFWSRSKIASEIFKVCSHGEQCQVSGVAYRHPIRGLWLKRLSEVKSK